MMPLGELLERFKKMMNDPERKSMCQIIYEVLHLWVRHSDFPFHYYPQGLYKKYRDDIADYVGNFKARPMVEKANAKTWFPMLDNKLLFHAYFANTSITVPRLMGYGSSWRYWIDGQQRSIRNLKEFSELVDLLIDRSSSGAVFAKPVNGSCGRGVLLLGCEDDDAYRNMAFDLCSASSYIFEETITQHSQMMSLYPHAVNTLRIHTFVDSSGNPEVMSATLRMGSGGRHNDNVSAGGCAVGIDLDTGALRRYAYTYTEFGATRFTSHPDTGIVFSEFHIPMLEDALKLARSAAAMVPDRWVGWDVAIGANEPILVEGNAPPDINISEMCNGGYRQNACFVRAVNDLGLRL